MSGKPHTFFGYRNYRIIPTLVVLLELQNNASGALFCNSRDIKNTDPLSIVLDTILK